MPLAVKRLLSIFAVVVSFGISGVHTPLECLGLHGYVNELLFWMLAPAVLTLLIVIVAGGVALCQRRLDRTALIELALPAVLRLLFVVYPLVTNVAFEGFPCYEFEDESTFLKKDVSIACDSPYYKSTVVPLSGEQGNSLPHPRTRAPPCAHPRARARPLAQWLPSSSIQSA